jgi:signal transduction histidine kinase
MGKCRYRPLIFILIEYLVKIPIVRRILYNIQTILYTYPLFTGFIFLVGYSFFNLVPLGTGNYLIGIQGIPLNEDRLRNAIITPIYIRILISTVFISIPPLITLLLDVWKIFSNTMNQHEFYSYLVIVLSYFLPNLILYNMFHDRDASDLSSKELYLWVAITRIQILAITLGMLSGLFGHRAKYATNDSLSFLKFSIEKRTVNILGIFCFSSFFAMISGKSENSFSLFRLLSFVSFVAAVLLEFTTIVRLMVNLLRQAFQEKQFRTHYHMSDFLYASCFALYIFVNLFVNLLAAKTGGTEESLLQYMVSITATQIFLICIVSIIPGLKFQKLAAVKHDQLETRLNLIRYVSHEMRTPLNTVSMGTTILKDEIVSVSGLKRRSLDSYSQPNSAKYNSSNKPAGRALGIQLPFDPSAILKTGSESARDLSSSERVGGLLVDSINRQQFVHAFKEMLETCQQIAESCTVAVATLDDLLTFDKIDENKLVIEVEELNPFKLLVTTAKPFTINALLKNVTINFQKTDESHNILKMYCVRGDAFKLAQVIRNLLSNAIKFTPEGGKVDVGLKIYDTVEMGRCVRMSVKDSGAGISKQNMKKLFGQYVQFNAAQLQKGKGSGLGLWITKSKLIARL